MEISNRLKLFRDYLKLSQVEFAEKSGLSQANITHYESGKPFKIDELALNKTEAGLDLYIIKST